MAEPLLSLTVNPESADMNNARETGLTLVELMMVMAVFVILAGASAPSLRNFSDLYKLGNNAREVERELQTARLKAVASNRPIRLRFNCPGAGQYRLVEVIGSASAPDTKDSAADRCQETAYPYPAADKEPLTRPNHDGPVRRLSSGVTFGAAKNLEFLPNGSVRQQDSTTFVPMTTTEVTLVRGSDVKKITVNGLGKIRLVP